MAPIICLVLRTKQLDVNNVSRRAVYCATEYTYAVIKIDLCADMSGRVRVESALNTDILRGVKYAREKEAETAQQDGCALD